MSYVLRSMSYGLCPMAYGLCPMSCGPELWDRVRGPGGMHHFYLPIAAYIRTHMYRRIMRSFRKEHETQAEYMQRSAAQARAKMENIGAIPWDIAILSCIFDWAGHVSRMQTYDQSRLAWKLLRWRDYNYLVTMRGLQRGRLNRGHRRRPWRWDHFLGIYFNSDHTLHDLSDWHARAQSREEWEGQKEQWCVFRLAGNA